MKTTRLILSIYISALCFAAHGQQVVVNKYDFITGQSPGIQVKVVDSEKKFPLGGALVRVVKERGDTLNLVCDRLSGSVRYEINKPRDSLEIIISHLGYKELRYVHKFTSPHTSLTAHLEVNIFEIPTVIVHGKRLAMVIRGDTIVHNAAYYNTMRGDPLEELLKKIPGIEYENGVLYAHGQRVSYIKVDNKELFASAYTDRALELIRSDDVEEVKVYDEYSKQDKALGDTVHKDKKRVLDVVTKSKKNIITSTSASSDAGIYADKNPSGEYYGLYALRGVYDRHLVNNNLSSNLGYGKNKSSSITPTVNYPGTNLYWICRWDKFFKEKKYNLHSWTSLNSTRSSDFSNSFTNYFPTDSYSSRTQTNDMKKDRRNFSFMTDNLFSMRISKRQRVGIFLGANGNMNSHKTVNYSDIVVDDALSFITNPKVYNSTNSASVTAGVSYNYRLKSNKDLNLELKYTYGEGWGDGWSIDTLASSSQHIFLTNTQDGRNINYKGKVEFPSILVLKKISLRPKYTIERRNQRSLLLGVDRITGLPDLENSYDYTYNNLSNNFFTSIGIVGVPFLSLSLNANYTRDYRDESQPEFRYDRRSYFNLTPGISYRSMKPTRKLQISYSESISYPSIEQLRNTLITSSAPLYTVGNPSLKETVTHNLFIVYDKTNIKNYSSWNIYIRAVYNRNPQVGNEYFFTTDTQLPEYGDFTFPAGSTLRTVRNARGSFSLVSSIRYTIMSEFFKSKLYTELGYTFERTPYYNSDVLNINNRDNYYIGIGLNSNFSKKIEFNFSTRTGIRYSKRNEERVLKEFYESASGRIRYNFAKRLWLNAEGNFSFSKTTPVNKVQRRLVLNCDFSCKFGKDDRASAGINFDDIFNQSRSYNIFLGDDYISTEYQSILGRNVYLSLSYRF